MTCVQTCVLFMFVFVYASVAFSFTPGVHPVLQTYGARTNYWTHQGAYLDSWPGLTEVQSVLNCTVLFTFFVFCEYVS